MALYGNMRPFEDTIDGLDQMRMMSESTTLAQVLAYVGENKLIITLEAES